MKVLHLVDTFEAQYERDQIQIVRMCREKGINSTVVTSTFDSDGNPKGKAYFRKWDEALKPVTVIRPPSFKLRLPRFIPMLIYLPHPKLFDNYDLLHIYTIGSYCFFLGSLITRIKHAKVVVRAEMTPQWHKRLRKSWIWQQAVLRWLKKADAIYAFTKAERERLLDVGIPKDKVFVIPVGMNYTKLSAIPKKSKELTVGYFGRFIPFKGTHRLVSPLTELAKEFPNTKVVFAGPQTVSDYSTNIMEAMGKCPNFEYLGILPSDQFYQLVDIVLVPSVAETGSITTLEAMACGKAVIASNISPMNEYVEHQLSGLLVDEDEEFYHYCKELIQNPDLRARLGQNAQRKAESFDQNKVFDKVEEMYDFAIGKTKRCL